MDGLALLNREMKKLSPEMKDYDGRASSNRTEYSTEPKFYVYGYYEPGVYEPFYIGKGTGNRAYVHLTRGNLKRKTFFYNKLRNLIERGIKPVIEIIQDKLTEKEANNYEECMIRIYGRRNLGTGNLCNLTFGGEGTSGYILSVEHVEKTRKRMFEKEWTIASRRKLPQSKSKPKSKIDRENMKKYQVETNGIRIQSFNIKTGETIKTYEAIHHAAKEGFDRKSIGNCAKGYQRQHNGVGWRYV